MPARYLLGEVADFPRDKTKAARANGVPILVIPTEGGFCALKNQCSHMPLPLAGGTLENNVITCPWHNSKFDACTGENLDWVPGVAGVKIPGWSRQLLALGKQPTGVQPYKVVEDDGKLYIEM